PAWRAPQPDVLAEADPDAPAALSVLVARIVGGASRASPAMVERRPDDRARQAEPIEPLALVAFHPWRQEILLPHSHPEVVALEQLDGGQNPGRTYQPMRGMQVMATKQERRELLGRADRPRHAASVDLAALDV